MEDQNIYVIDDRTRDQQQQETLNEPFLRDYRNDDSGHMYMAMNAAQVKSSEYETLQVGNTTVAPTETIKKKGKDLKKTRIWMIIIILLTVLAVFTVIALAVGALGLWGNSNIAAKETDTNYTYLMEEISALKYLLAEMKFETRRNISQLDDRLFSSANRLSNSANSAFSSIRQLSSTSVSQLSEIAHQLSASVSSVSTSVNEVQGSAFQNSNSIRSLKRTTIPQLSSAISDLSVSESDIYFLSTSLSKLSTSISTRCTCPRG